jgi:cob(I)alamin adenosyltransferase
MSDRGDKGLTSGECNLTVAKDSPFVEAVGAIDKFQARLGWVKVIINNKKEKQIFCQIEKDLNEIMGNLYLKTKWKNGRKRIEEIEKEAEKYKIKAENFKKFLIPGENEVESRINICRTDCREAERRIVAFKFDENLLKYFNKLSYFLNWVWRAKF